MLTRYKLFSRPPPALADWEGAAVRFPDELGGAFAASIAAYGSGSRSLEQSGPRLGLARSDALMGFVRKLRLPGLGLVIDMQHLLDASPPQSKAVAPIARALADHAQDFILIFAPSDRALFADALRSRSEKLDEPARGQFATFLAALAAAPCGVLCSVPVAR